MRLCNIHAEGLRFAVAAFILLAGLIWPGSGSAQERVVRLGLSDAGYPPYLMQRSDSLYGIVGDVFVTVATSMNYRVEIIVLPKKRLEYHVKNGEIDAVAGALEWRGSDEGLVWTDGIIQVSDNVVSSRKKPADVANAAGLAGKNVALMNGYGYPSLDTSIKSGEIRVTRVQEFSSLLRMVAAERVDYGVLDRNVAYWVIRDQKLDLTSKLYFSTPGFDEVAFRIIFYPTRDWASFVVSFNSALKTFKRSAGWENTLSKYR